MKRIIVAIFAMLIMTGCSWEVNTYSLSAELLAHMWNTDYKNYDDTSTTDFVQKHYTGDHLEAYMRSLETSEADVIANKTVSTFEGSDDLGTHETVIEGTEYTVQRVRARVNISGYDSEHPSYFEVGDFVLIYNFYFEDMKISGFDFLPEEGAFVPAEEKTPLTDAQSEQISEYCKRYLNLRYELSYDTYDPATVLNEYEDISHDQFLEWEDINIASLRELSKEFKTHLVHMHLVDADIDVAVQKQAVFDGEVTQFYYYAELSYTYDVDTDEEFLAKYSMAQNNAVKETLYFDFSGDELKIILGEYDTDIS